MHLALRPNISQISTLQPNHAQGHTDVHKRFANCSNEFQEWLTTKRGQCYLKFNDPHKRSGYEQADCFYHEGIYWLEMAAKPDKEKAAALFWEATKLGDEVAKKKLVKLFEQGYGICEATVELAWAHLMQHPLTSSRDGFMRMSNITATSAKQLYELRQDREKELLQFAQVLIKIHKDSGSGKQTDELIRYLTEIIIAAIDNNHPDALKLFAKHFDILRWNLSSTQIQHYLKKAADELNDRDCSFEYALTFFKEHSSEQHPEYRRYILLAAKQSHLTALEHAIDLLKNGSIIIKVTDELFAECTYCCAFIGMDRDVRRIKDALPKLQNLVDSVQSKAIKGQAAYLIARLCLYALEINIESVNGSSTKEIAAKYLLIAKENNYQPALWEAAYSEKNDLIAILNLSDSFLNDPVLTQLPHSREMANDFFKSFLKNGVTEQNVKHLWSYIQRNPKQLTAELAKQIYSVDANAGGPSFAELIKFIQLQNIDLPLIAILTQAGNDNIPGAKEALLGTSSLRTILFTNAKDSLAAQKFIVEKCHATELSVLENRQRYGCYFHIGVAHLQGDDEHGISKNINTAIQYFCDCIKHKKDISSSNTAWEVSYAAYLLLKLSELNEYELLPEKKVLEKLCRDDFIFKELDWEICLTKHMEGKGKKTINHETLISMATRLAEAFRRDNRILSALPNSKKIAKHFDEMVKELHQGKTLCWEGKNAINDSNDYQTGALLLLQAANKGYGEARTKLKDLFAKNKIIITPEILPHALSYFDKFPNQVTPEMQCELCLLDKMRLAKIVREQKDDRSAFNDLFRFLKIASDKGLPGALNEFTDLLISVIKIRSQLNDSETQTYLKNAADKIQHRRAAYYYAEALAHYGDKSKQSESIRYYEIAADKGDFRAQLTLAEQKISGYAYLVGIQYLLGNATFEVEQNTEKAIAWLVTAVNQERQKETELENSSGSTEIIMDPRAAYVLAGLYEKQGDTKNAAHYLELAARWGHWPAKLERKIQRELNSGNANQEDIAEAAHMLSHILAENNPLLFPQPDLVKAEKYQQIAEQYSKNEKISDNQIASQSSRAAQEYFFQGMSLLGSGKTIQAFKEFLQADKLEFPGAIDQLHALANELANKKLSTKALHELVDTLIAHYGENIPSAWHIHIKLSASLEHSAAAYVYGKILLQNYNPTSSFNNFLFNPLKEIKEYFHMAGKQGHLLARKALIELGDYTYSKELGNLCAINPDQEMPKSDAIKYLAQAANMNNDDEAAASLVHIFERFDEDDYQDYFSNGTVKNKKDADQLAQQYRKKGPRKLQLMTKTNEKFELHDQL